MWILAFAQTPLTSLQAKPRWNSLVPTWIQKVKNSRKFPLIFSWLPLTIINGLRKSKQLYYSVITPVPLQRKAQVFIVRYLKKSQSLNLRWVTTWNHWRYKRKPDVLCSHSTSGEIKESYVGSSKNMHWSRLKMSHLHEIHGCQTLATSAPLLGWSP